MTDAYTFHQTPKELAKELMAFVPVSEGDVLLEPFRGEGAFYDAFPTTSPRLWAEIEEGKDFRDVQEEFDWVITNPPFSFLVDSKRTNAFWTIVDYYSTRARKGMAFLFNDNCFSSLTPIRLTILQQRGWGITFMVVCNVKKWRGRYYFIIFEKKKSFVQAIPGSF